MAGRSPRASSSSAWPRPSPTGGRPRSRSSGKQRPPSVQLLHEFLCAEYGYSGSYKSVRKFVRARYGRPPIRPFRRVETPPGAQSQSDWGEFRRRRSRRRRRTDDGLRLRHGPQPQPQGGRRLEPFDGPARLAPRPQRGVPPARRRGGGQPDRQPQDGHRARLRRLGTDQRAISCLCADDGISYRCVRGSGARTERKDGAPRGRLQGPEHRGPALRWSGGAPGVDRRRSGGPRQQADLPGDGPVGGGELGGREAVPAAAAGVVARAVRPGQDGPGAQGLHGPFRGSQLPRSVPLCRPHGGGPRLLGMRADPRSPDRPGAASRTPGTPRSGS